MAQRTQAAARRPAKLTLRVYNVGFGDCFLLTFHYATFQRRVLIDFGSTATPQGAKDTWMLDIANDIAAQCRDEGAKKGKLHAIVATHRHRDHISGFTTSPDRRGPGDIIAGLEPDVVVQPWTEDPSAEPDAKTATTVSYTGGRADRESLTRMFLGTLEHMHAVSKAVAEQAKENRLQLGPRLCQQLSFLGENNLKNLAAIKNLMRMGQKGRAFYVHCDSRTGLEAVLPGVEVAALGPPDMDQSEKIRKERSRDPNEFWQFRSFWQFQAGAAAAAAPDGNVKRLFPNAEFYTAEDLPANARWFVHRARQIRGDQMLELVRCLDSAMNNTSVILLFTIGKTRLLFPGDAQIENWSYALNQEKFRKPLADVNLYKVGHHGSLNATPKSLWKLFAHRSPQETPDRLQTVMSTKPGKHGSAAKGTEVPRRALVEELKTESEYFSTQDLKGRDRMCKEFEILLK
jgi:hypothetical protein